MPVPSLATVVVHLASVTAPPLTASTRRPPALKPDTLKQLCSGDVAAGRAKFTPTRVDAGAGVSAVAAAVAVTEVALLVVLLLLPLPKHGRGSSSSSGRYIIRKTVPLIGTTTRMANGTGQMRLTKSRRLCRSSLRTTMKTFSYRTHYYPQLLQLG